MGISLTSRFSSNGKKSHRIDLPEKNQQVTIPITVEENVVLNFPLDGVHGHAEGNTLVLECPGGQCIYLPGALAGGGGLIQLASGKVITVDELMELQARSQEMETGQAGLEGGVDRLGALDDEGNRRGAEPPEEDRSIPDGRNVLSQGGGASARISVGSGVGEFRSDSGHLVEGIWALPDQLTDHWGWDSSNRREHEDFFHSGPGPAGPAAPRPGTSVAVSGGAISESASHISFSIDVSTTSGDCTVSFTVGGGSAVDGADYDLSGLEYYDGSGWVPLTPDANGVYTVSVPGGLGTIRVQIPLTDDALSERDESVGLTVTGINRPDGSPVTDFTSGSKLQGAATIVEDNRINEGGGLGEKEGPVISIERTSALYQDEDAATPQHAFKLHVDQDLNTAGGFAGVADPSGGATNVLLQDIVITMNLGGTATPGADFDFAPSPALQALIDSGQVSYTPPDANGNFTLTLNGVYDANGNPNPTDGSHPPLTVDKLGDIIFHAPVHDDGVPELPESVVVTITGARGNESDVDPNNNKATGMIADDANSHAGPKLSLHSPTTTEEKNSSDTANAPADTVEWHRIDLHVAAPDPIRTVITLAGKNGAVLYDGTNGDSADFKWSGTVEYSTDGGATWQTMPAGNYSYNDATGKCDLTIPTNATNVRFGVTTIDDMRETTNETGESYDVTLELVQTGGHTDASAVLDGNVSSLTNSTGIIPEARPAGSEHLNPPAFDGPYVAIEAGAAAPVAESGGNDLPYTVRLENPDGSGGLFGGTTERVTVQLTVSGSDGFQIQDLFPPINASGAYSGTITYQAYDANGLPVGSLQTVTVSGDGLTPATSASSGEFSFNATLPPGAAYVAIKIPVNDDPLGGTSSGTSSIERLEETVKVQITDVAGNEARVDGNDSASATIRDDTAAASFEGVKVGLSWEGGNDTARTVGEGGTEVILLRLFNNDGSDLTVSPYQNYMESGILPEDLSVKLSFTNTPGADGDMALQFSSDFLALVQSGKATVTINGLTYSGGAGASALSGLDIGGDFTVTLKGGSFDLANDLDGLSFNAHAYGDNVREFHDDPSDGYGNAADERFGLTVTEVSGNESSIQTGAQTATGTITDMPDGRIAVSGGDLTISDGTNPGSWGFTVAVTYPDNEKTNHPGVSGAPGSNTAGSDVTLPGDGTVITIRVTDGEVMEHGQEYTVTAYDLFLSVNGLTESDVSQARYADILAGNTHPADSWILVRQNGPWADTGQGKDSASFDLEVPREYWDSHPDGQIDLTITQGDRVGALTTGGDGGFTVSVELPGGNANRGELAGVDSAHESRTAEEDDSLSIHMTLEVNPAVYENETAAGDKENIATFSMKFAQFRNGSEVSTPFCMGREFSFEFTLRGSGSAELNTNTQGNTLYPNLGDFALCDADGTISSYTDINDLTAKLQDILIDQYGYQADGFTPNVTIALKPDASGDLKFKITVSEGVDLSDGIDLHFVATDNNTTDSGRTIDGVISNIQCDDPVISIEIKQDGGTATIQDERSNSSGFAIAVGDGYGYEKTLGDNVLDGNGTALDGTVHIPVYAYILGNGHMPGSSTADGEILSLAELVTIYNAKTGAGVSEADAVTDAGFRAFVDANFHPTQPITITIDLADGTGTPGDPQAVATEDYKDKTTETLDENQWTLVIETDSHGEVHIYYKHDTGCTVESIDDIHTMADKDGINLTVTVNDSENNESRPVETGPGGRDEGKLADGHDSSANGAILDYHGGPRITQLGPVDGKAYEPNDAQHGPVGQEQHVAADKATAFAIQLDKAATEKMVVWLDISDNGSSGGAVYGQDYAFGQGLCLFKDGKFYRFDATGAAVEMTAAERAALPPHMDTGGMDGKYFAVINEGQSSASFDVLVKDDNRTEINDEVTIKVVDVQGGEATYTETIETSPGVYEDFAIPWAKDVPYEYHINGVGRVLVDPAHDCYTTIPGGVRTPWTDGNLKPNNPGYAPQGTVSGTERDLQIADDGDGPVVSIDNSGATKVDWFEGDEAPTVTITLQDYCQEEVTVSLRVNIGGVEHTLSLKLPAGTLSKSFSPSEFNELWKQAGGTELSAADRRTFDVQITNSSGGETDYTDGTIRVTIYTGTGPAIRVYDLENTTVTEGWAKDVPGAPDGVIQVKMDIPSSATTTITADIHFSITVNGSALLENGGSAQVYTVPLTAAQLTQLQSYGTTFTVQIVMNGATPEVHILAGNTDITSSITPPPALDPISSPSLPAALGDQEIGDTSGVGMSISGVHTSDSSNVGIYADDRSIGTVVIKDGTSARLLIFVQDGTDWKLVDGSELSEKNGTLNMKAALVLVDEHGHLVSIDGAGNVLERFDTDGNLYDASGAQIGTRPGDIMLSDLESVTTRDPWSSTSSTAATIPAWTARPSRARITPARTRCASRPGPAAANSP